MALIATSVLCVAPLTFTASSADAAPYPPTQPCSVTATARGEAAPNGTGTYDVVGSGLGSAQPVRVVLARTGQQVGAAETDASGTFRTVVTAPADAGAPNITATSPGRTCTTPPPVSTRPTGPATSGTPGAPTGRAGNGSSGTGRNGGRENGGGHPGGGTPGSAGGQGTAGDGAPGAAGGSGSSGGQGSSAGSSAPASTTSASGSDSPGSPRSSAPAVAEPIPGTDTPFGIGLGIAAVLLVLGTLAVLLLTRRSER